MQIFRLWIHVKQAGDDFTFRVVLLHETHGRDAISRVVVGSELAEAQQRAVVLNDLLQRPGSVFCGDRLAWHHHVQLVHGLIVLAYVVIAFSRAVMIVEGHAR